MRRDPRKALPYTDPLRAGRHPFQIYMLALAFVSGLPLLFGQTVAESVEKQVPVWMAFVWGAFLVFRSAIALVGSTWRGNYANDLPVERVGLDLVGAAAMIYGVAIFTYRGSEALLSAAIIFGFGVSCIRRARDIHRIFRRAKDLDPPLVETEDGR